MVKRKPHQKDGASLTLIRKICERKKHDDGLVELNLDLPFTGSGPNITNMVCGVHLNCVLELRIVALHARNVDYRPKRFPAVTMRIREPKCTALIFASGKMQVIGALSISDAHLAHRKIACKLTKLGFNPSPSDFKVQNLVANADFGFPLQLEGIALRLRNHTNYEPELFPALVLYLEQPRVTGLIFAKGKVVFLGAKDIGETDKALQAIWMLALAFRKV